MAEPSKATETAESGKSERRPPQAAQSSDVMRAGSRSRGLSVFEDLDRLFDEFMSTRWPSPFGWQWPSSLRSLGMDQLRPRVPSVDICENDNEVIVRAEVPGVDKDNLDVSIADRTLTIKGRTREEQKEEREDYYRREIRSGEFSRSLLLPCEVDAEKASASLKDGIVELRLPKAAAAQRRRIPLS
ncbi:MAG TPA: Hsp20/alpha crystallin family protein [Gammaproteobacteria bacterium]